jgi:hypothetical protein
MSDPYSAPGALAQGAGDINIHFMQKVEHKQPSAAFYELGSRCQELVDHYGY